MSITAFADTKSDPYELPSAIHGYKYSFTSEVWERWSGNPTTTVEAVAYVKADANVPIGYMGGQARLYNSSGSLVASSSMTYNKQVCELHHFPCMKKEFMSILSMK
ncbi:hypothetical protein WJ0W_000273 [Paenibacillus melissococcoides]|uniref:Uncharacterized protein n=1 Tax=Paenibacillus melissococcoides TaxID=2912268 RepID=A0ABM9FV94_9BACL|nr:hypothetical protein J6TS7_27040 [Paenibacillus dendritiformis]CAH8243064.1 hypothetical protein WJ0W_000273 [Paenibacillus melissococcoides]